jgi:hypothetical protein
MTATIFSQIANVRSRHVRAQISLGVLTQIGLGLIPAQMASNKA